MTAAALYVAVLVTFAAYLAYCAIWEMKRNGRLAALPFPAKVVVWNILVVAVVLDVIFNWTVGTVAFLDPPREFLFTARCKRWRADPGRRGKLARWVCEGWLNPFQPGHC